MEKLLNSEHKGIDLDDVGMIRFDTDSLQVFSEKEKIEAVAAHAEGMKTLGVLHRKWCSRRFARKLSL
jgi:hypothetical protein